MEASEIKLNVENGFNYREMTPHMERWILNIRDIGNGKFRVKLRFPTGQSFQSTGLGITPKKISDPDGLSDEFGFDFFFSGDGEDYRVRQIVETGYRKYTLARYCVYDKWIEFGHSE